MKEKNSYEISYTEIISNEPKEINRISISNNSKIIAISISPSVNTNIPGLAIADEENNISFYSLKRDDNFRILENFQVDEKIKSVLISRIQDQSYF